ncbi:4'-phosphopantetheinyl transferase superfamily protein [Leuconostoc suionicum]|uniref:4'-phosphopantetheinyl transferase family protein n=1 Tax=Leuconostoc suionicum TaxID=1511761 RepID=UPI0024ADBEA8|nr:4'-phosphopantetheinyl transferase superfamily protein [Leuconostoc suionicum]MDI6498629.1 4'-phosphopantetheinyl transferase superfamily protein [Leuconostoc suionicum]MDI6500671.1 4'-phosphopantetheinyl transferase superfamily protein [Leuconostoc suionicum]MDI6502795.1 4'-phosphopantetheinyl transferase superfamily protein [Leuconostoc suionicum]MDI6523601.1 4'-phosphopantetheinyl transferase superfamily protein [Leuconostoc suionicum]MDI6551896.1 4'-phosphopantetheinyl transferase super
MIYILIEDYNHDSEKTIFEVLPHIFPNYCTKSSKICYFKNTLGSPKIYIDGHESIKCSISHKNGIKIIVLSDTEIGVDIESKKIDTKLSHLFHTKEQKIIEDQNLSSLTPLWSLKEAAAKAIDLGFTFGINSVYINAIDDLVIQFTDSVNKKKYVGSYYLWYVNKFTIALVYAIKRR